MFGLVLNALRLALAAIARNRTRAFLTVLGIFIGIAAVVTVVALASGASDQVGGEIDSFAANAIYIHPQSAQASGARSKVSGRLTDADAKAIQREAVSVIDAAPWLNTVAQVVAGDKNASTTVAGTTLEYYPIRKWTIGKGENWTRTDELLKTKVCVIGTTVSENLFGHEDPIGRVVRINNFPFRIVGILGSRGNSTFGDDQDDRIMMPIGSYRTRIIHTAPGRADQLMVSATSAETTDRAVAQIDAILRQRHHIAPDAQPDFDIFTQAQMRETQESIFGLLQKLLLGVAAISLLVGGIGIMNIMLVSVAERTREIGIRMSIGARERDILLQFLVEAVVLTMIGGVLGMISGVGLTLGIGRALDMPMTVSGKALGSAVATAVGIGLVFGFFPALNAAKLDPIEALRTD
jgi:putative ABC transport system permease protein